MLHNEVEDVLDTLTARERQTSIFRSYMEILGYLHDVGSTVQRKRSIEPHSA